MIGQATSYWDFQPSSKVTTAHRGGMLFSPRFQASKSCSEMTVMPRSFNSFICASKRGGRDLGAGIADLVHQTMITKDNYLGRLIDKPAW
jgi:hypothetical protein